MADTAKLQLLRELQSLEELLALRLERASSASSATNSSRKSVATMGQEVVNAKVGAASLGLTLPAEKPGLMTAAAGSNSSLDSNKLAEGTPGLTPLIGQSKPTPPLIPSAVRSKPDFLSTMPSAGTPGHNNLDSMIGRNADLMSTEPPVKTPASKPPLGSVPPIPQDCSKPDPVKTEPPVETPAPKPPLRLLPQVQLGRSKPPVGSLAPIPEELPGETTAAASSGSSAVSAQRSLELKLHAKFACMHMHIFFAPRRRQCGDLAV